MKRYIPLIADSVLAALCVFLLFFTLVRYYYTAAAGLAAGIVAGAAAGTGAFFYIRAKQFKRQSFTASRTGAEKLALHLAMLNENDAVKLLEKGLNCTIGENGVPESESEIYFMKFTPEPCNRNDILTCARFATDKKKYFCCGSATPACAELAEQCGIKILGADAIYEKLKDADALPEKYLPEGRKKPRFFALIKSRFTRRLCLPAFWSGAALLLFSYFTYYPVYYITVGSLLLAVCAVAAVFGKKKDT